MAERYRPAEKLGGILSEAVSGAAGGDFAVVGIAQRRPARATSPKPPRGSTSISSPAGRRDGRAVWIPWPALDRWYNVLARGDKEAVIRTFEGRAAFPPGAAVRVETAAETFAAKYRGLDAEGRLIVDRGGAGTVTLDAVLKLDGPL
jgi:biotin-(acetyl-CoA carboxylase) ligase